MTKPSSHQKNSAAKNRKLMIILAIAAFGMFGFGFALVPIYDVLCKVTGLNGKVAQSDNTESNAAIDKSRTVTVQFLTTVNSALPWHFYPLTETIKVHPGEITRVSFFAKNNSSKTMTVQAIPSVSPGLAAKHLKKTECFCFNRQTFNAGESLEMPVLFHLDTDLPKNITIVTLSYTLFDASESAPVRNAVRGRIS